MIFNRSMSRRRAAIVLGGKDLPSGVRTVSSFTLPLRSLGLKLRTPNWIKADFMRLTARVCSWTNPSRSRCGRLASSSSMVGTIATVQWPRSPRSQPRKPRFNIAVSSRSVLARRCSRDTVTLVAWMTCASMPRSRSQRASQKLSRPVSYATAIRVIGLPALIASSRQPCSSLSRSSGFGSNFFSGSRLTPGISPATSQFDKLSSMTAISVLSCMNAAGLALLLSWGFCIRSSVNCKLIEATILQLSRRLPHSIFFCAFHALAVDDGGGRTGFPLRAFATLFIERVVDSLQCAVIGPQIEVAVDRAFRWQVLRDRAPLTASRENVHEAVHHLPHDHRPLATAGLARWDQRFDQSPFLVGQIARISQLAAVVTGAVLARPHRWSLLESGHHS